MLGTKTLIVLSSDEAVKELLDRRSGIYSDRPDMYIGQTLCSDDLRMLMMVRFPSRTQCRNADHFVGLWTEVENGTPALRSIPY